MNFADTQLLLRTHERYRRADNFRRVSFTASAWEGVYATNLSRQQRETREKEGETSERHVGKAHSVLITAILLPQRLSCYWGKQNSDTAHAHQS
jgi:hypothetical protein